MKRKNEKWFDPAIIKEDESKTTAYEKHFILNNGTRKAVFSPTNMNYYDKTENKWKAIDNTLKSAEGGYLASFGDYTAKVSKAGDKEAVELTNGSDAISWEYLGTHKNVFSAPSVLAAETAAKPKSRLSVKARNSDALHISRAGQAVYKNAAGGIDLDYRFEGNGIKENIMIKDKSESYRYYFLLHISGFDMKLAEKGGDIGFYRKNADAEADDPGVPEFIMPAPFMYDANGSRSNAVRYAFENMGNGNYVFSVEADAEWINAPERIFPVCVDPQLLPVDSSYITVSHAKYQHAKCSGSPCCGAAEEWEQVEDETYYGNCVCLKIGNCCKINATLHIRKPDVDFTRNKLISTKLIFPVYEGKYYSDSATIKIGTLSYSHRGSGQMIADITGIYDPSKDVSLEMQISNGERLFAIPTLQIEYQSDSAYPICKSFAVEKGATTEMNVISGDTTTVLEDISDPRLGITVSHVYKPNDEIPEYGRNFRLNLDEKLKKIISSSVGAVYVYTDPQGDKHTFKEHFYRIGANGEKVYISSPISSITADTDGRLWLGDTEVFRELTTDRGLRASSKLEGVNNAEWVEQRSDEEKQAEEQVKAYRNMLHSFVSVNKKTGAIFKHMKAISLNSPDAVEAFLNQVEFTSHLLLSEEEAMAFKSLLT